MKSFQYNCLGVCVKVLFIMEPFPRSGLKFVRIKVRENSGVVF